MKFILFTILSIFLLFGCSSTQANDPTISIINGYTVPPMPDKKLNNATLLGIDSDNNGIRDDIDRHIAEMYPEPMVYAVAELRAKSFIDKFKDPENAYEKKLYLSSLSYIDCESYIFYMYGESLLKIFNYKDLDNKIINTAKREKAHWIYNNSLSGHAFSGAFSMTEKDCPAEINDILKNYKKIK